MKLALFGNGGMGQLVRAQAVDEGHEVALVLTSRDAARSEDEIADNLRGIDAAIDFSVADAVLANVSACARANVPLVEGTTGWNTQLEDVRRVVEEQTSAFIYGANFSIGVNLFYRIVARAAELFQGIEGYAPFIEEAHHARKRDAPSGTALRLRKLLASSAREIPIASTRAGFIPGTHRVGFDSAADQITLTHTARTREGFAAGALLAARWIIGRRGVYEFSEMLDKILDERTEQNDDKS
ncbi:MAG: 4-hydroxy-tetrahydrodipicolinate reductase [Acidobacteriota bacterium]|jgi:4-hydroxy-tetrahydrodipicolinate reductase|nr:4-hydroxy-tetrahydrodipicolinate reductase [Acidobacteriota bacterium]